MNLQTLHNTIRSRVQTEVQDKIPILVKYDNERGQIDPTVTEWVLASIRTGQNEKMHVGRVSGYRQIGSLTLCIFVRAGEGDKRALQIADAILPAFRDTTVSEVVWETPSPNVMGLSSGWWQVNIDCPFRNDTL